jgi:UDP-N-acetylmuramoyl-L-alanyl-D-glutamate--2,6-diaminopimelate ligase
MEVVSGNNHLWVIVDYAHNEDSMENLLKTLKAYEPRRLICVFGCGGNRSRLRRTGMGRAAGAWADISVVTEDNSRYEPLGEILSFIEEGIRETGGEYVVVPDRREAIGYAVRHGKVGDIIAIIGKGHEEYQETKGLRMPFSDREEALRALSTYK